VLVATKREGAQVPVELDQKKFGTVDLEGDTLGLRAVASRWSPSKISMLVYSLQNHVWFL
jgi:hypothetical protein